MNPNTRWKLPLAVGALVLVAAGAFALFGARPPPELAPTPQVRVETGGTPVPIPPAPPRLVSPVPNTGPGASDPLEKLLQVPQSSATPEERQEYPLRLEELRAKLPDNLYWKRDAPTTDPEVLRQRDEEARQWNTLFGKVQAGDASEEEIQRYYDYRRKISEDYISMASLMLTEYGDTLPERDQGLIALSIRMHRDRLAEVPRQIDEALARKKLQDQRREEWRRSGKAP
jgi:hypothetical protein